MMAASSGRPSFVLSVPVGGWHHALPMVVRSLKAQTADLRLAVLDASGDARVAGALDALGALIAYRRCGRDAGQAAAIQEGWEAVAGDIYGWLNADDFLYPGALERVAAVFTAQPRTDVVTAQSQLLGPDLAFLGAHPGVFAPGPLILRTNMISQPSTFVRRRALEAAGWLDTGLHYTMDWELWVRLWRAGARFEALPDCLSGVVTDAGTKTARFNGRRAREIAGIVARHAGPVAAAKSLLGTWLYHRREKAGGQGVFGRLYARGRTHDARAEADDGLARAGLAFGHRTLWPLVNYGTQAVAAVSVVADGPLEAKVEGAAGWQVVPGDGRIAAALEPGEAGALWLRPAVAGGAVRVAGVRLLAA